MRTLLDQGHGGSAEVPELRLEEMGEVTLLVIRQGLTCAQLLAGGELVTAVQGHG